MNHHRQNVESLRAGLYVVAGNTSMQASGDDVYPFRQESNFFWLTGINEPDWWVIIDRVSDKTWLVRPNLSRTHQTFDGSLADQEALKISGADVVLSRVQAMEKLKQLSKNRSSVFTIGEHPHKKHFDFVQNPAQSRLRSTLKRIFYEVEDCRLQLASLRSIKQPYEIEAISDAIDHTINGFQLVHQQLKNRSLKYEYEIEAEFSYLFKKAGNLRHAYDPIVAGGKNSCTLHYRKNKSQLKDGIVLMDIGASVDGYSADITRSFAFGKVTDRQRQIHAAVETAHHSIIALLKPGLKVETYLDNVDKIMKQALASVGLFHSDSDYRKYFPHAISHGLGLDTHDSLAAAKSFKAGMILTVEPGIYIPEEGIGVRIEDDILITDTGHKNLSGRLLTGL